MDYHDQTRFGYTEPDDSDSPRCRIVPVIGDDDRTIVGYAIVTLEGQRIAGDYATSHGAAQAAEALGFDPWMSDDELDDEDKALDNSDIPF